MDGDKGHREPCRWMVTRVTEDPAGGWRQGSQRTQQVDGDKGHITRTQQVDGDKGHRGPSRWMVTRVTEDPAGGWRQGSQS